MSRKSSQTSAGHEIRKATDAVAEKTAEKTAEKVNQTLTTFQQTEYFHSGPIPPAAELARYNELLPGAADRILSMAEQQAKHRQELESTVVKAGVTRSRWGLAAGFVVAMTISIGGIMVALDGSPTAGALMVGATLSGLVGVFVYGSQDRRRERQERAEKLGAAKR